LFFYVFLKNIYNFQLSTSNFQIDFYRKLRIGIDINKKALYNDRACKRSDEVECGYNLTESKIWRELLWSMSWLRPGGKF
jgi:hypothetical protein